MFELGSSLREARLRQGLDFPQLEVATKIRGKYLRALEDEDFDQLPAHAYVKGFLRTYADYLGLDGQLYVDEFNSRHAAGDEQQLPIRARRTAAARQRRTLQSRVVIVALAAIVLVTALVIAAWKSGSNDNPAIPGLAQQQQKQKQTRRPHATAPRLSGPASITLIAKRDVLLTVRKRTPTGKVLYNDTLPAGTTKHFTTKRLWVQVGTPENLRVTVNSRRVRVPVGGPGIFTLTARGLAAS